MLLVQLNLIHSYHTPVMILALWPIVRQSRNLIAYAGRSIKGEHHCDGRNSKPFLRILFRTNLQFSMKICITYL